MQQWLLLARSALTTKAATTTAILSGRVAIVFGDFARVAQAHGPEEAFYLQTGGGGGVFGGEIAGIEHRPQQFGRVRLRPRNDVRDRCLSRVALLKRQAVPNVTPYAGRSNAATLHHLTFRLWDCVRLVHGTGN
jgi:hypothetical protein